MVSSSFFIFAAVSFHFISILGLKVLPRISSPTEVISSIIHQVADDSKIQEFLPIFQYFVNFTALERQSREQVNKVTATHFIEIDENQQLYGSYAWQDAIIEALNEEENVTGHLNETDHEDVIEYINKFINKPEALKERYIQNLLDLEENEDIDVLAKKTSAADETSYDVYRNEDVNEFWDSADTMDTRRIFRGNKTKIRLFPFMASVHIFSRFTCAGAIISSDLVITAASCLQLLWNNRFFRENPALLSVRIGSPLFSVGGEVIPIQEVYFYPTYVPKTLENNLALMRLQRRIKFKRKRKSRVKKITIDRKASALSFHTPGITIIGWGAKRINNMIGKPSSHGMHMAVLDFYDLESCREIYGKKFVTRKNFCAGFITKGQGACNHDVGDPGVVGGTLMGVTSFGSPVCGRVDTPTVFTKVGYYAEWIDDIMEMEVPHIRVRTTTLGFQIPESLFVDLGKDSNEGKPISALREMVPYDVESSEMMNEPIAEELGIEPLVETAPTEDLGTGLVVREGHYSSRHSKEDTDKNSQEGGEMDGSSDDTDYFAVSKKSPVIKFTKIISDDPPKDSMSSEKEEVKIGRNKNGIRTTKAIEIENDKSAISDTASNEPPDTNTVDPKEYMWSDPYLDADEKDKTVSLLESDYEHHGTTGMKMEDPILDIQRDFTVSEEIKHTVLTTVDDDKANLRDKERNKNKQHSTTPNIAADIGLIEVRSVEEKQDDILRKQQDNSKAIYNIQVTEQSHDEVVPEVSEDEIKREIEKLIRELDVSSESTNKPSTNSNSQDTLRNENRDRSNERLTFLYVSDSEKKIKLRTGEDTSDDEGLSIDPKPFEENAKIADYLIGDLIGEKDVYDIFADVINTMVNKTFD